MNFRTRLNIGFASAILFSAVSGVISYNMFQKQATQTVWVGRERLSLDSVRSIQTMLVSMEADRRGYRVTNQPVFLEPYTKAVQNVDIAVAGLKKLLANSTELENKAIVLEQRINSLMQLWAENDEDSLKNNTVDITKLTNDEKVKMDSIRVIILDLQQDQNKLLAKRQQEYDALIHDSALSSSIDSLVCEAIIIILVFFVFNEFKRRRKAEAQLKNLVEKLEDQTIVLRESEEELKAALEAVGTINKQLEKFVYTVAHDIKSPLAGISSALSVLEVNNTIIADPELAEFVHLSSKRVRHLSEMVNSILEYSRVSLDQQQVEPVDTKKLVEEIAFLMFPPKHISITVADKMPAFVTKRIKIMEVFQNLMSNAIKYNNKKQGDIEIGCNEKDDRYVFYVKDNGIGIAQEHIPHIFTLFRHYDKKQTGESSTGFGLNIVKLIVEEQGGKIWVDSTPGIGSTFYFEWMK